MNRERVDQESGGSAQLEFSQAMTDFKIMFPNMDVDVIEAVLRSNNGAVDTTIDQLLTMTADNEPSSADTGHGTAGDLPSYTEAVDTVSDLLGAASVGGDQDMLLGAAAGGFGAGVSLRRIRGWNPPILGKLPSDFLRLRSARQSRGHAYSHPDGPESSGHSHEGARARRHDPVSDRNQQLIEDEKFAMMLQNEEFMRELRGNQEFMNALEEDHHHQDDHDAPHHHHHDYPQPQHIDKPRKTHLGLHMDDAVFREKLKNMGKTSKAKFSKLATMFSRQVTNHSSVFSLITNSPPIRELLGCWVTLLLLARTISFSTLILHNTIELRTVTLMKELTALRR